MWIEDVPELSVLIADHTLPFILCTDHFHFSEYILQLPLLCCAHVVTVALNAFPHILPVETLLLSHFTLRVSVRADLGPTWVVVTCVCVSFTPHCVS